MSDQELGNVEKCFAADLAYVRALAAAIGLLDGDWGQFINEAKALKCADGALLRI